MYYQGLINTFREFLPVSDKTPVVTLNEGNTPLIKADNLAKKIGVDAEIYLKFDNIDILIYNTNRVMPYDKLIRKLFLL